MAQICKDRIAAPDTPGLQIQKKAYIYFVSNFILIFESFLWLIFKLNKQKIKIKF